MHKWKNRGHARIDTRSRREAVERIYRIRARAWSHVLVLLAGVVMAGCPAADRADEDQAAVPAADTGRYKAEVDEGLGASIAILLDQSGSMEDEAQGDQRPKYVVAREALETVLAATDSFVAAQPDLPVNIGLYTFASSVQALVPMQRYNRDVLRSALDGMAKPKGGTAIGDALHAARAELYRAGTFRKYILIITDGENTDGRSPERVAQEIARRSEGAVRMYFVAFDIAAEKFDFVRSVRGEVVGAANGAALKTSLNEIYRGKILAEAINAGETLPDTVAGRGRVPDTTRTPETTKQRLP